MATKLSNTKGRQGRQAEVQAMELVLAQQAEQEAAQVTHNVTVATLLAGLEEARQAAKERGDAQAMVSATMGKARIAGLV
jgi:hypothetical protein